MGLIVTLTKLPNRNALTLFDATCKIFLLYKLINSEFSIGTSITSFPCNTNSLKR